MQAVSAFGSSAARQPQERAYVAATLAYGSIDVSALATGVNGGDDGAVVN